LPNPHIIIATTCRSVINNIDLKDIIILENDKTSGKVNIFNYGNSKDFYDEFVFTGLNNFDFIVSEFYKTTL
jgi:hypothetical protein